MAESHRFYMVTLKWPSQSPLTSERGYRILCDIWNAPTNRQWQVITDDVHIDVPKMNITVAISSLGEPYIQYELNADDLETIDAYIHSPGVGSLKANRHPCFQIIGDSEMLELFEERLQFIARLHASY